MEIQPDFRDLLKLFKDHGVEFLITSISGVSWDDAESHKVSGMYGDVAVSYLGRDEFVKNKYATGRKKDIADLEALGEE